MRCWERQRAHVYACMDVSMCAGLRGISDGGVRGGGSPERKMNASGRAM